MRIEPQITVCALDHCHGAGFAGRQAAVDVSGSVFAPKSRKGTDYCLTSVKTSAFPPGVKSVGLVGSPGWLEARVSVLASIL
jgi:hypothetical protein